MGTVVSNGDGEGVVVSTGRDTEFGKIAAGLGERQEVTEFQAGLRHFSVLLVEVAGVLTTSIFVINMILQRPLLESLLFSLAIAVGITPQLLPAVVTTSLATGSRRLARLGVLVKRLVCIEDLGDIEILLTDKTGTLTEGRISFVRAVDPTGRPDPEVFRLGLLCNEATVEDGQAVGGNPLDVALWEAPDTATVSLNDVRTLSRVPFDHDRRMSTVLVDDPARGRAAHHQRRTRIRPRGVCDRYPTPARRTLDAEFAAGGRVVAVATRPAPEAETTTAADEHDLTWSATSCSWTNPNSMPPHHSNASQRSASPSRSSPATTPSSPRRSVATSASTRRHDDRHRDRRARRRCTPRRCRRRDDLRPSQSRTKSPTHPRAPGRRPRRRVSR